MPTTNNTPSVFSSDEISRLLDEQSKLIKEILQEIAFIKALTLQTYQNKERGQDELNR